MIGNLLVSADRVCDYIPIISTVSNTVGLFQKYCVIDCIDDRDLASGRYYTYLKDKSTYRSLALLIPGLGNLIVGMHDLFPTLIGRNWYAALDAPDDRIGLRHAEDDGVQEPSSSDYFCFGLFLCFYSCSRCFCG